MPRYFVNTISALRDVHDKEGVDVADYDELDKLMRRSITRIAHEENTEECGDFCAIATDVDGRDIMKIAVTIIATTTIT